MRRSPAVLAISLVSLALVLFHLRRVLQELRQLKRRITSQGRRWLEIRYRLVRAELSHRIEKQVEVALNRCAEHARGVLKDPAMPSALQRAIDHMMDGLLPDIKHESFRVLDEHLHFLQPAPARIASAQTPRTSFSPLSPRHSMSSPDGRGRVGGGGAKHAQQLNSSLVTCRSISSSCRSIVTALPSTPVPAVGAVVLDDVHLQWLPPWLLQLLRRGRAAILHTLWPHDRSLWQCARTPTWWALQLLGVMPFVGTWWWLLLAFAVDKEDEFQLCQFIVALRCTHFVTLGLGAALHGCIQAYRCAAFAEGPAGCAARLPSLTILRGVFWLVQLAIVARAFSLLPYSKKKGQRVSVERRSRLPLEHRRALATGRLPSPDAAADGVAERGGVLLRLGAFDLALAAVALAGVAIAAIALHAEPTRLLRITLYHIRTCHGLLSFPYVLLRLPGANTLLTHVRRTGYDRLGHCVPYAAMRTQAPPPTSPPHSPPPPPPLDASHGSPPPNNSPPDAPAASPQPRARPPSAMALSPPSGHASSIPHAGAGAMPSPDEVEGWPGPARRLRFPKKSFDRMCDDGSASGRVLRALSKQFGG